MTHLITCPPVRVDQLPVGDTLLLVHRDLLRFVNLPLLESPPFSMATPVKKDSEYDDLKEQVHLLSEQMKKVQQSDEETSGVISELKQQAENAAKNHKEQMDAAEEEQAAAAKQMDAAAKNHKEQMDAAKEVISQNQAAARLTSANDALSVKVDRLEKDLNTMRENFDAALLALRKSAEQ